MLLEASKAASALVSQSYSEERILGEMCVFGFFFSFININ